MSTENQTATAELVPGTAAPAENGADANTTQQPAEGQTSAPTPDASQTQNETPEHRKFKGRISDLTRDRNAAREEAAYWRGIAEAGKQGQNATPLPLPQEQPAPQARAEPNWQDGAKYPGGKFDPQYLEDMIDFRAEKRVEDAFKAREKREQEAKTHAEQEAVFNAGREKFIGAVHAVEALEAQNPQLAGVRDTLEDIARAEPFGTPGRLIDIVTHSENPEWVAAALATKPGLLQQIGSLNPTQRALAVGRIDAQISANLRAQKATPATPPPPPAAPPPNTPGVTPALNGKSATPSFNPETASMAEYANWRASQPH